MKWLSKILGPARLDPDIRAVARFEGKTDGEHDPVGTGFVVAADHQDLWPLLEGLPGPDGQTAAAALRRENLPELLNWLETNQPDPCARAIVRLLSDAQAKGLDYRAEGWINLYWHPGIPPKSAWDGPATLSGILKIRIRMLWEDPRQGFQKVEFEP